MYWPAFIITAILLSGYCGMIGMYRKWFLQLPLFVPEKIAAPATKFSVIIPARNEEDNIANCLQSVLQQDYPADLFEVIVINDHSTDRTEAIVRDWQERYAHLHLLNLSDHVTDSGLNAYKKKAIEIAVAQSQHEWIVTTDADCEVHLQWLTTLDRYIIDKQPVFVAAPVMFHNNGSFIAIFQLLDFISLQGITAAAVSAGYHTMCNGANIAYRKDVFIEVEQFKGIDNIASGDDMLLMHKIKTVYPKKVGYLFSPDAVVYTEPMFTWKDFINQRIRWASKADKYHDKTIFWALALVYAVNFLLLGLFIAAVVTGEGWGNWLILLLAKTLVELSFMIPVARFYGQTSALWWFPVMQPFHILYTVIAGWLGRFGTYRWKGRNVR